MRDQESLTILQLRAEKALQHSRLLRSQNYIHIACRRELQNRVRTALEDFRAERARLITVNQLFASILTQARAGAEG